MRSKSFLWWLLVWWGLIYGLFVVRWIVPWGSLTPTPEYDNDAFTQTAVESGAVAVSQFQKYNQIYDILQQSYYDAEHMDIEAMQENALKGFVDGLEDPYSVYLTPEENQIFDESMQGSQNFEGIGAVVTKKDDGVMIEAVLKGMPAFNAGLKPLDLILQIDDEPTAQLGLNEAVLLIRGEKGSTVNLTVLRGEDGRTIEEVEVIRDSISVPSVEVELIEQDGKRLAYAIVSIFGDDTISLFEKEIRAIQPFDGIILDLRGNGGWYLPTAVELASFLLPRGEVTTTAKYSIFPEETFRSFGYELLQDMPVVVLIDEMSASASEIVAAAMQQRGDKSLVVGQQSFGKWSIQTLHTNADGSSMKYTIGRWYMPNNVTLDGNGVDPDLEVEMDFQAFVASGVDIQYDSAVQQLINLIDE